MEKVLTTFTVLFSIFSIYELLNQPIVLGVFILAFVSFGAMRDYLDLNRPVIGIIHNISALLICMFVEFMSLTTWSTFLVFLATALSFAPIYLIGIKIYLWKLIGWVAIAFLISSLADLLSKNSGIRGINFVSVFCFVALAMAAYELIWQTLSLLFRPSTTQR